MAPARLTYPRTLVDRDQIERQDFPAARRGYDVAAVHEHLGRVADEFEALARRPAPASLAEDAASRVQTIVEAAETSARQLREDAGREASEHVARAQDAASRLLARLDELQAEVDALLAGLRSTAESLTRSLDELSREAWSPAEPPVPAQPPAPSEPAETSEPAEIAAPPAPSSTAPSPPAPNGARSDDEAGARLVALNMALEGSPREDAASYLAEHYELADLDGLLDDVYASAGR